MSGAADPASAGGLSGPAERFRSIFRRLAGWRRFAVGSGEDGLDHVSGDVGEPVIASVVAVGEFFVVEAHEVEDGGVEVVDVDFVVGDADAVVVRGAVDDAGFDAAAGEP